MIKKAKLLEAALSRYRSQRDEALAVLEVYLTDAVGIGEHSSLVDEITKWTQVLSEAEENIETLHRHYLRKKP
jgi:hypothetical protein